MNECCKRRLMRNWYCKVLHQVVYPEHVEISTWEMRTRANGQGNISHRNEKYNFRWGCEMWTELNFMSTKLDSRVYSLFIFVIYYHLYFTRCRFKSYDFVLRIVFTKKIMKTKSINHILWQGNCFVYHTRLEFGRGSGSLHHDELYLFKYSFF